MEIIKNTALAFDDIDLIPQYSDVESRTNVDLSMSLFTKSGKKLSFSLPIISSPMQSVTEEQMAFRMWVNGGLGILHRFCTIERQSEMVHKVFDLAKTDTEKNYWPEDVIIGASIGVNGDFIERAKQLISDGVQIICVDIAHGHHKTMKVALSALRKELGDSIHIMAGNVAIKEAFRSLSDWGADSVRVGISSGAACSTAINTGHGLPTLQSVIDCADEDCDAAIIADGGIKKPGDLVKAFAAGADFCMLGSMLAGTKASPGNIVKLEDGKYMKEYFGSASTKAQQLAGKTKIHEEGVSALVPYSGKIENILESMSNGLRSGCSYTGVHYLKDLQIKAKARIITHAGYMQAVPHVKFR